MSLCHYVWHFNLEALLSYCEPLSMDRLILHDAESVCTWHSTDRQQILAVAHRGFHVARRNVANLTQFWTVRQLGSLCVRVPLMTASTYDRGDIPEIDRRRPNHTAQHPTVVNCDYYSSQGVICLDGRALLLIRTLCLCARSYQNCIQTPVREVIDYWNRALI